MVKKHFVGIFIDMKICRKCLFEKELFLFHKDSQNKDGYKNTCKECCKLQDKKYYIDNSHIILKKQKEYKKINRKRYTDNEKYRRDSDPIFKLKKNIRKRVNDYFKSSNIKKNSTTFNVIGKSPVELKEYIELQFVEGMSWDNYGDWHIDHIIPLVSAKTEDEIYKLNHYSNLQPLWAKDNMRKGGKII